MQQLATDGIIRVNMWTRIVREAGQTAAGRLFARREAIAAGDFEATESRPPVCHERREEREVMT
jgi:hypothetical protein